MSSTTEDTREHENYPTPGAVVASLMRHVRLRPDDTFCEPCMGDAAIYSRVPLPDAQKDWAELRYGRDYLTHDFGRKFDVIITNPPFSLAEQFIRKSLRELAPDGTMIYLQRINFLGSVKRVPFWAEVGFPDKTPVIIPRPRFVGGGSDSCEYCWFTWDRGGRLMLPSGLSHIVTEDECPSI